MTDSFIQYGPGGTSLVGPDATDLFRAAALRSALGLLAVGITPTRGLTRTKALVMVTRYTGKTYKRSQLEEARSDLKVWIETMHSALPHLNEKGEQI